MKRLLLLVAIVMTACGGGSQDNPTAEGRQERHLRLNIVDDPATIDPRKSRDLASNTLCSLLFEGLMRVGIDGEPELALAESVEISENGRVYTFHLRESNWSNGDPLTAFDFVYTYRTMLDPLFPAPQADKLYVIKNAQKVKEGFLPAKDLGVRALGDHLLTIELERPVPYFLQLAALRFMLPINSNVERTHPQWATRIEDQQFSSNGPFRLVNWRHHDLLSLEKNPEYWDADSVHPPGVDLTMVASETAFQMFERGELDWAGSPLDILPTDALQALRKKEALRSQNATATEMYRLNVNALPFTNSKIRRAFALAMDREAIVNHLLQGVARTASGFIPPSKRWSVSEEGARHDVEEAKKLLAEGMAELGLTKATFPTITITYSNSERKHLVAQAVQQDWEKTLGVSVILQSQESKVMWDRLRAGDYQVCAGSWFADVDDPSDFLNVFKSKSAGTNNTGWEDPVYTGLLAMSETEEDPKERTEVLQLAEKVLLEEMPIIPIFHYQLNFLTSEELADIHVSPLGSLECKHAYFK